MFSDSLIISLIALTLNRKIFKNILPEILPLCRRKTAKAGLSSPAFVLL